MCTDLCRACGQPIPPQKRGGIYLPPRKARIFDAIDRYPGISVEALQAKCVDMKIATIRVHICQINDMLAATDLRIRHSEGYRITGAGK